MRLQKQIRFGYANDRVVRTSADPKSPHKESVILMLLASIKTIELRCSKANLVTLQPLGASREKGAGHIALESADMKNIGE
ncbi:hypothetical protein A3195_00830 [Candidatus Thiodiazotropha endoloripes]|uniref:Uncharacterized protein n=1 Tax=Candidatus Thiodiazotropha endoloripes TaxID=1818881 RepID=A0A1E2UQ37_9GAMM|nr:hypothetical protein A3193_01225 [Candidatus Thiodiazotropha endoloripes]ODB90083.1 hypothetical protein A3195_00830 [Candidatus Thiodiazotropha endoloripes]ODB96655.1 hypothetical protein A3196_07725 [Candidatus Thiodiazotropha endoloripes]